MTEQRQHIRYQVEFPAILAGDCAGMGIVYNLGIGGCKIVSDLEVRTGALLTIHLKVLDQSSAITIQAARVQWTMKLEFGVEFQEILKVERARLDEFLATQMSIAA